MSLPDHHLPGRPADAVDPEAATTLAAALATDDTTDDTTDAAVHGQVVRGSSWYVASVGVAAVGGFIYWVLAARANAGETQVVGRAAALFSVMLFVNYLTNMGLPVAVARFAPANTRSVNVLFNWALLYTAVTSLIGTLGFFALASAFLPEESLAALWQWGVPFGLTIFFLMVAGQSFAVLVEVRLVTLRHWGWVFGRVVLVALLRMPLLLVPAVRSNPLGLLVIMAGTPALSGFIGALALRYSSPARHRAGLVPVPPEARPALRYASVNYVGLLAAQAPQFVLPLIVVKYVTAEQNAAFYLAWTITTVVFLMPHTVGQVVLAEGSRLKDRLGHQVRLGLVLAVGLMVAMSLGAFLTAELMTLRFFGASYQETADLLPRLVAAGIPWAITAICLARARALQHSAGTITITVGFAVCTLVPAAALTASSGVAGAASAWFVGNVLAALVAVAVSQVVKQDARARVVPSPRPVRGEPGPAA
jgi:O-antigen/teichoic acid export membrane protein